MLLRLVLLATAALALPAVAQDADESALDAFEKPANPAFKPPEAAGSAELRDAVRRMAQRPSDPLALTDAGYASLKLGDANAALNFLSRANGLQPGNARILAGLGSAYVRTENPFEALRYFDDALKRGANERSIALDRALAFDLLGNFDRAQQDYKLARSFWDNDEAIRRQAMSLAMAGKASDADAMLVPLLQKNDPEAWRARALMLAARGEIKEASQITQGFLDAGSARRFEPYLRQMARLTDAQKAAAFHFGHFPVGRIGEDSAEIRSIAATSSTTKPPVAASGQERLIPAGEPLGSKGRKAASAKREAERKESTSPAKARREPAPGFATQTAQAKVAEAGKATPVVLAAATLPPPDVARPPVRLILPPAETPRAAAPASSLPTPGIAAQSASLPTGAPGSASDRIRAVQGQPADLASPTVAPARALPTTAAAAPPPAAATAPAIVRPASTAGQGPLLDGQVVGKREVKVALAETAAPQGSPGNAAISAPVSAPAPPPISPAPTAAPKAFDLAAVVAAIEIPDSEQQRSVVPVDLRKIKPAAPKEEAVADSRSAKPKVEAKAPPQPARIWVQIATGAEPALGGDYRRFSRKSPELFKGKDGWTSVWGKSSRLLVGPFADSKAAKKWEADFRKDGGNGFVWQSETGTVVKKLSGK